MIQPKIYENYNFFSQNNNNSQFRIDPRITEYMKMKRYYDDNCINSDFLEQQFAINQNDYKIINAINSRSLNTLKKAINNQHQDFVKPIISQPETEKMMKNDKYMKKLREQEKQNKIIQAKLNKSSNYYDNVNTNRYNNFTITDFSYDHVPKISYENQLNFGNNDFNSEQYNTSNIIKNLKGFKQDCPYTNNSNYDNQQTYKNNCKHYKSGSNTRGKHMSYNDTFEHNFSYISSDIQDPEHVVSFRPTDTRILNKSIARQYSREIMS